MNRDRSRRSDDDDEWYDNEADSYDDSQGYDDDPDEDQDYEDFIQREFGTNQASSTLPRLYFWTAIVVLISLTLPLLLYLFLAIAQ